jgi:hypothetical protein
MTWTTLTLQVTTPLFNGGNGSGAIEPDGTGIRIPSLRGAMRFWFRALAGTVTGPDLALLARLEQQVFGGTDNASPVRLRIPRRPALTEPAGPHSFLPRPHASRREREEHPGYWIIYLLGQGLGNLRDCTLSRPYVAPGECFDLKIRFGSDPSHAALALASLWLTCAYGGLGARTRRGFGGLRIIDATGPLPQPWDHDSIRSPALNHYEGLDRLWPAGPIRDCMPLLARMVRSDKVVKKEMREITLDAWPRPSFPVLSKRHTRAGTSGGEPFDDWSEVASHTGEQFRKYRASREHPEVEGRYWPPRKTPEWSDVVWGDDDRFPLGALGLPVNYKDGYSVNAERQGEPLRRASALWLRPVGDSTGWRLLSFAFLGAFLPGPNAPTVRLRGIANTRTLQVSDEDITRLADAWIQRLAQHEWQWFADGERPASAG